MALKLARQHLDQSDGGHQVQGQANCTLNIRNVVTVHKLEIARHANFELCECRRLLGRTCI